MTHPALTFRGLVFSQREKLRGGVSSGDGDSSHSLAAGALDWYAPSGDDDGVRIAEATLRDTMGLLRTTMAIENPYRQDERRELSETLVDTGSELTWVPRAVLEGLEVKARKQVKFQMANGMELVRDIGWAIVHAAGTETIDEVVFGEPGDLVLLGARSLQGLNLKVDLVGKRLVAGGPLIVAGRLFAA